MKADRSRSLSDPLDEREARAGREMGRADPATLMSALDALPATVAVLDARGRVIAVNYAWRRFAISNGLRHANCALGDDYLATCDAAIGDDAALAAKASTGIRSVLDATATHFSLEYPCHSPEEQRWFQMTASPLLRKQGEGAVVMHVDITERVQAEQKLLENKQRFDGILTSAMDAIVSVGEDGRIVLANPAAEAMFGYAAAELQGRPLNVLIPHRHREVTVPTSRRSAPPVSPAGEWVRCGRSAACARTARNSRSRPPSRPAGPSRESPTPPS